MDGTEIFTEVWAAIAFEEIDIGVAGWGAFFGVFVPEGLVAMLDYIIEEIEEGVDGFIGEDAFEFD